MGARTTEKAAPQDHLLKKQARRDKVPIQFSEENAERLLAAETAYVIASEEGRALALEELEAAKEAAQETTVVYHFQAMGKEAYHRLTATFPPTDEQVAEWRKLVAAEAEKPLGQREDVPVPAFDTEALAPHLIAASLVSPKMTADEVRETFDGPGWNIAEVQSLFDAALRVNTTMRRASAGKGSGSTRS